MNDQTSGTIGPVINKRTEYTVLTIGVDQGQRSRPFVFETEIWCAAGVAARNLPVPGTDE